MIKSELELITEALIKGQATRVNTLCSLAIENGTQPRQILEQALLPGMDIIGKKFRDNIIFISDVLIASRAMHAGLQALKPYLSAADKKLRGKIIIGTVAGDLHDIGKNLVAMMLRGAGYEVIDLGIDVQPEDFAAGIQAHQPDIVALSAMLTTTLPMIPETIKELERNNLRHSVRVIIGGRPTTADFAHMVKADGYASDAVTAVDLVRDLFGENRQIKKDQEH